MTIKNVVESLSKWDEIQKYYHDQMKDLFAEMGGGSIYQDDMEVMFMYCITSEDEAKKEKAMYYFREYTKCFGMCEAYCDLKDAIEDSGI